MKQWLSAILLWTCAGSLWACQISTPGQFSLSGRQSCGSQILFSDGFESGTLPGAWDSTEPSSPGPSGGVYITSTSGQVYAGTYAAKITYIYDNPGGHFDLDHYLQKLWSQGAIPEHWFARGYVKFHVNSDPFQGTTWLQRKIIYINATQSNTWFFVMGVTGSESSRNWKLTQGYSGWGTDNEPDTLQNRSGWTMWPSGVGTFDSVQKSYNLDSWYYWEVEVQLNSLGNADGYMKLWVQEIGVDANPILVIQTYDSDLRGGWDTSLTRLDLGEQPDVVDTDINEERYIDNFALATGCIGP